MLDRSLLADASWRSEPRWGALAPSRPQLLVEGAVIAASGAAVGLLVGIAGGRGFRSAIPGDGCPTGSTPVDGRVLAA